MNRPFIDDPSAYSSGEAYHKRRLDHLLTLGKITTIEHEEEEDATLTHEEIFCFKHKFVRNQWSASFQIKEASNEATVLWKIEKNYNEWMRKNETTSLDQKEKIYKAMCVSKQTTKEALTVSEFHRFNEWHQANIGSSRWSWFDPLNEKEFKQFIDKLTVDSIRNFNINGSFEEAGCIIWKGQRSNRSGVPEFRRIDPDRKKRTKHPVKYLYHFHREKIRDERGFVFMRTCDSEHCVNPFHFDYVSNSAAHKRRRLK